MSAFKQSMRKLGIRAGLLAGTSAAVLAIAGMGASSAIAAPKCEPSGISIVGKGASLQKVAQEYWTGREVPSNPEEHAYEEWPTPYETGNLSSGYAFKPATKTGYYKECESKTSPLTVSYASTGSGPGLKAFAYTSSTIDHRLAFADSDDAPNAGQITSAKNTSGTEPIIFPVAETTIGVAIHPPSGCKFEEGTGITWEDLNKIFGGKTITNWNQITNVEGTCNQAITRVVRKEGSGTTYQFKNYLSALETQTGAEGLPTGTGCEVKNAGGTAATTWGEIREIAPGVAAETPNTSWPACSGGSPIVTAAGGGAVAEEVAKTANVGYIGYAALPDIKGKGGTAALLENEHLSGEEPGYANPASGTQANCGSRQYEVPATGRKNVGTGEAVNWSEVFGASPKVGNEKYPLCTLTFGTSWKSYSTAGFGTKSANYAAAVKDYFGGYVLGAGQTLAAAHYYFPLPSTVGTSGTESEKQKFNVLGASELAVSKIG